MNNIEKAKTLINTFSSGNVKLAESLISKNYIQHNLAYPTGQEGFLNAVDGLSKAPVKTTVETIRAFEDKDKVFLHNKYNFAGNGEQIAFDIFRFDQDRLIAEHWDNLIELKPLNPSGHSQTDGSLEIIDENTEENRETVKNFIYDVLHGKNLGAIQNYFDGDKYIQHNPDIADGLSGLSLALTEMAKANITMVYEKTHQILAQGNFVLAVSEGNFADKHTSFYDLFRVENGKIVEHWDIIEYISSEAAHNNGKF